ncbi:MAG: Tad domain-containing protein, partial [Proteobacteria bacterium]|nr:Tad domain-containing protein [Pseudomonadota bacterium]
MDTTWLGKLGRLLKGERAGVAAVAAIMLTVMVGMIGAVVDLGLLYATKNELQNAADAAALAGASTLVTYDQDRNVMAQPDVAITTAQQVALANQALGVNLQLRLEDITLGLWVEPDKDFDPDHICPSSDPNYLSACRVVVRRDNLANSPVSTIFAGAVGFSVVNVTAMSTAYLGYPGSVGEGMVDLPIAVKEDALTSDGSPICGQVISFHSENVENAEWTSFFTWPANDPNVRDYVDGTRSVPALKVGDEINLINGNLSNNTFNALANRFENEGSDLDGDGQADSWEVLLPVVSSSRCGSHPAQVVGFAHANISEVRTAPYKDIIATLQCGMVVPGSSTGGG